MTAAFFTRTISKIFGAYISCGQIWELLLLPFLFKNTQSSYLQSIKPRTDGLHVSFCSTALRNNAASKLFSQRRHLQVKTGGTLMETD